MSECPFCEIDHTSHPGVVACNPYAFAVRDINPVSPGHTLVIPLRHVGSFFELTGEEQRAVMALVNQQHAVLQEETGMEDCNVGLNDGPLAGQTVPHCHVHIIPRFEDDVADPRGGIRWVIPDKADYWSFKLES
jgi:diadenosine tetraphosphate (Ap4A) HIT family hydrolase